MQQRRIHITIDQMGKPTVEAIGFNGMGCAEATEGIEHALSGGTGIDRVLKPEWSNQESEDNVAKETLTW
jgi:hypothetical protein